MVDIHSHVLWDMDDGPDDRATSIQMLKLAAEGGTSDIVATPHANSDYAYAPETIDERIADLQREVGGAIRLHRGCDFHLSYDNIEAALADPATYTINGGQFLLVEFADSQIPSGVSRIFDRFMSAGIFPIITHPERNPILSHKIDELASWAARGAFLQITAKSIEGGFGGGARDAAWKMLSRGIVHFVASDAHDPKFRSPRLDAAFRIVAGKMGQGAADLLFESNPRLVISGGDPAGVIPPEAVQKRSLFRFFGK